MLVRARSLTRAGGLAALRPHAAAMAPRRLLSKIATMPPQSIVDDDHLFPDQVLEEEKTGFPVGLPQIREADLWKDGAEGTLVRRIPPPTTATALLPSTMPSAGRSRASVLSKSDAPRCAWCVAQLAERAELWWDDGTAEPEWFVDRGSPGGADGGRPWSLPVGDALGQLTGVLAFIGIFVGGAAYLLGDKMRPAANRWDHGYPQDMRAQFGLVPMEPKEAEEDDE